MSDDRFDDRVTAVISGKSAAMRAAIAELLKAENCNVTVCSYDDIKTSTIDITSPFVLSDEMHYLKSPPPPPKYRDEAPEPFHPNNRHERRKQSKLQRLRDIQAHSQKRLISIKG